MTAPIFARRLGLRFVRPVFDLAHRDNGGPSPSASPLPSPDESVDDDDQDADQGDDDGDNEATDAP